MDSNITFNNEYEAYSFIYERVSSKSYTYFTEIEIEELLKYVTLDFLESLCINKSINFDNCMFNFK